MLKRKSGNDLTQVKKRAKFETQLKLTQGFLVPIQRKETATVQESGVFDFYPRITRKLISYLKNPPKGKSLVVQGPPGHGKTFLVRNAVKVVGLPILEIGLSTFRSGLALQKLVNEASQSFTISFDTAKKVVIFIDDIDIVLEPDKGFLRAVEEIIQTTRTHLILACSTLPSQLVSMNKVTVLAMKPDLNRFVQFFGDENKAKTCQFDLNKIFQGWLDILEDADKESEEYTDLEDFCIKSELFMVNDVRKRKCSDEIE